MLRQTGIYYNNKYTHKHLHMYLCKTSQSILSQLAYLQSAILVLQRETWGGNFFWKALQVLENKAFDLVSDAGVHGLALHLVCKETVPSE